jgi:hypothetical protein
VVVMCRRQFIQALPLLPGVLARSDAENASQPNLTLIIYRWKGLGPPASPLLSSPVLLPPIASRCRWSLRICFRSWRPWSWRGASYGAGITQWTGQPLPNSLA